MLLGIAIARQDRLNLNKALHHYVTRFMQSALLGLQERASQQVLRRSKREMLHLTIAHVDQSSLKMTAFSALALHKLQEEEKLGYLKL